jgi:type II secretory ATPase GspE/PulE/Tfp pilus assembly ATPase PilB-like protein
MTGIFEYMEIRPEIADLIFTGASLSRIRDVARTCGYLPLFEAGLEKVSHGEITLEELLKETTNIEDYAFQIAERTPVKADANPV